MWDEYSSELRLSNEDFLNVKQSSAPKNQRCPYFLSCGGCQLLNWDYPKQIAWKEKQIQNLLKAPLSVIPAQQTTAYRNKNSFSFITEKYITQGGFFKAQSKTLIPIEHCLIQDPHAEAIFLNLLKLMKQNRIEAYSDKRQTGVLRHAVVRTSESTQEIMLILVVGVTPYPGRKNFIQAIKKAHPEITTIVENVQAEPSPYLLGKKDEVLFGKGYIQETLFGLNFKLGARSFFQIHPKQAEVLFDDVLKHADLTIGDKVIDAYSGVGVLGMLVATRVKQVVCVESNDDAVYYAKQNVQLNQLKNVSIVKDDATHWLANQKDGFDVLMMDPPREGASVEFLAHLVRSKPKTIIYISCNPKSLARDLNVLSTDYSITHQQGFDLFPQTVHVETVVILKRI